MGEQSAGAGAPSKSPRSRRRRSSLLWGLVGALSVLVAGQGYRLVAALPLGTAELFALAAVVGGVVVGLSYVLEPRLPGNGRT